MKSPPFLPLYLILILAISPLQATPKIDALVGAFEAEVETINTRALPSLTKLSNDYLAALSRLMEEEKKKGSLDGTIELKKEIERWKISPILPDPLSETLVIKKAQLIYQNQEKLILQKKGNLVLKSYSQLETKLAKIEKLLVSSDKVEEAQNVRARRDELKSSDLIRLSKEATNTPEKKGLAVTKEPTKPKRPKTKEELQQYLLTTAWTQNNGETVFRFYEKGVFGDKGSSNRYKITGKDTLTILWGGSGGIRCEVSRDLKEFRELNGARATFNLIENKEQ